MLKNINTYKNSNIFLSTQSTKTNNNNQKKKNTLIAIGGASAVGLTIVTTGLASRGNFAKNSFKKGLIMKNGVLINKQTGETFTGKIKSNIGKIIGFSIVETRAFENGIITEKTYKNIIGQEKAGTFYKDGKECLNVFIKSHNPITTMKEIASHWRNEKNTIEADFVTRHKGSAFNWARKLVKEVGWFTPPR